MHAKGIAMHIDRAHEIAVAAKPAGAADPISALGFMSVPALGTPTAGSSFGAGEARDAGLLGFMGEVVDVLAVFPQGHPLIVMTAAIAVAHTVRVADEERADFVFHAEVNDLAGRLVP